MTKGKNEKSLNSGSAINNSIIQSMSHHMNSLVSHNNINRKREGDDSFYIEANDYHSIALNTAPFESNIKMRSPFVSKTERYPDIKQSPGPGDYDIAQEEGSGNDINTSPQAFGTTYKNRTHFLNVEKTPFGDPSFLSNPGVGHYYKEKKIPKRIKNEIIQAQKEIDTDDGLTNKLAFMGSSNRPCLAGQNFDEVGPGKYDVSKNISKSETGMYAVPKFNKEPQSIFISTSSRFKNIIKPNGNSRISPIIVRDEIRGIRNKIISPSSKKISRLKKIKQDNFKNNLKNEKTKPSFVFQSDTKRFVTPKPAVIEDIPMKEYKEIVNHAALFGTHQKNLYNKFENNIQEANDPNVYVATIGKQVGFSTKSPRFRSNNQIISTSPGPGEYDKGKLRTQADLKRALQEAEGTITKNPNSKMTAAFKSEERLKHAMINLVNLP